MFRYTKRTLALEIVVILAALALLMPFWILVTTALTPGEEGLTSAAIAPPRAPPVENYKTLLAPSSSASAQILMGVLILVFSVLQQVATRERS